MRASTTDAARRWAAIDHQDPQPSWNELSATIGIAPPIVAPGDLTGEDAHLAAHWPAVADFWEPRRRDR